MHRFNNHAKTICKNNETRKWKKKRFLAHFYFISFVNHTHGMENRNNKIIYSNPISQRDFLIKKNEPRKKVRCIFHSLFTYLPLGHPIKIRKRIPNVINFNIYFFFSLFILLFLFESNKKKQFSRMDDFILWNAHIL